MTHDPRASAGASQPGKLARPGGELRGIGVGASWKEVVAGRRIRRANPLRGRQARLPESARGARKKCDGREA